MDRKVKESEVITSFYLKPRDGVSLPLFQPGQYITVKVQIPGDDYVSLSVITLFPIPRAKRPSGSV